MAQPAYFLKNFDVMGDKNIAPGGRFDRQILQDLGLDVTFRDVKGNDEAQIAKCYSGPNGLSGVTITYQTPDHRLPSKVGYQDEWEWHEVSDRVWIGIDPESPPTPQDMIRKRWFNGYVEDQFTIPFVRRFDDSTALPCNFYFHRDGDNREEVHNAYRDIYSRMPQVHGWFKNNEFANQDTFDKFDAARLALDVLSVNYRISEFEQNILGTITTENFLSILSYAVDYPGYCLANPGKKAS